jgi:hypothetical protein
MNPTSSFRRFMTLAVALSCILFARNLRAQADSTPASLPNVQVKEWLIIVCDPYRPRANAESLVDSSLPEFISDLRPRVPAAKLSDPSPIGLIRFFGQTDQKITVRLTTRVSGVFYGSWPDGRPRPAELLWRDLTLGSTPRQIMPLLSNQWINVLRNGGSALINSSDHSEKFLLYDVEFPFSLPLKLSGGKLPDDLIEAGNLGTTPLHDVVLYRPDRQHGGWTHGVIGEVPPATMSAPATSPSENSSVHMTPIESADPSRFLADDWKPRLAAWEIEPSDIDLIVRTLKAQALDDRAMTAVFRLDEADLSRVLTLEITPPPAKVSRVALVIARNIDPALSDLIDQLISQLGSPDWKQREAATDLLANYGPAAQSRLQAALGSKDQEIVVRAERLLRIGASR